MKKFTLAKLLLFAAFAALLFALWRTNRELAIARTELLSLRRESRVLDPSEPNKLRAIEIPAFGNRQWRWKIKLPENRQFVLRWAYKDIPNDRTLPAQIDPKFNPPKFHPPEMPNDEFLLTVSAFEEKGEWKLGINTQSASHEREMDFTTVIEANDPAWLSSSGHSMRMIGGNETTFGTVDKPFELLRFRKGLYPPSTGKSGTDPNPTDGILLWIESK